MCVGVSERAKERVTDKENRRRECVVKKSKCVWGTARPSGSPRPPGVFFLSILRPWNGSKFTAVSSSLLSSPPSCQLPLISILHLPVVLSSVHLLFILSSSMPFILVDISLACLWVQNSHEFGGLLRLQGVSLFRLVSNPVCLTTGFRSFQNVRLDLKMSTNKFTGWFGPCILMLANLLTGLLTV